MSQNDRDYSEKRDFIRMNLNTEVTLDYPGGSVTALCHDLSSTGMQLSAKTNLSVGTKVRVHIASEHSALKGLDADAEVIRVTNAEDGQQTLGLSITAMK